MTDSKWTESFSTLDLIKMVESDIHSLSGEANARDIKRSIARDHDGNCSATREALAAIRARLESE